MSLAYQNPGPPPGKNHSTAPLASRTSRITHAPLLRAWVWMRWLCRDVDAEPRTDAYFNSADLFSGKRAQTVHQPYRRHGDDALCIECARAQKSGRCSSDFKPGLAKTRCVRNKRNQRSVRFFEGHAKNKARAHLCSEPEVNHVDLTAKRCPHPLASRRSNSWKT